MTRESSDSSPSVGSGEALEPFNPCPFCGNGLLNTMYDKPYTWMECTQCLMQGPVAANAAEAKERWNRRSPAQASAADEGARSLADAYDMSVTEVERLKAKCNELTPKAELLHSSIATVAALREENRGLRERVEAREAECRVKARALEANVATISSLTARVAELESALRTIEERWTKSRRHPDCDDYQRGYGQAEADIGQFARAALQASDKREKGEA